MMDFPEFMKRPANRVPARQQNTADVEGYYYTAPDGSQMAFWTCHADRISKEHAHEFDEYMVCVSGEYVVSINGEETVLHAGLCRAADVRPGPERSMRLEADGLRAYDCADWAPAKSLV